MACAYLAAGNTNTQFLASGANVSFGSAVTGFGKCRRRRIIELNNTAIALNQPGYYAVDIAATVTSSAAGNVTLTLYNNGSPVTAGLVSEAVATADDPASVSINAGVAVPCGSTGNLTLVATSTAGMPSIGNIATNVVKAG